MSTPVTTRTDTSVWHPESSAAAAEIFRVLCGQPWLVAGRDDAVIELVQVHQGELRTITDRLGWSLVVGHGFVRLRKSPPVRPRAWAWDAPTPLVSSWLFLLVAAAESLAPRVGLNQLVSAARTAASEAGLPVTGEIHERRAIVAALRELDRRGVIMPADERSSAGAPAVDLELAAEDAYVADGRSTVQLVIHHARLAELLDRAGPDVDPALDPRGWLAQARHEPDPGRRVRRRLVDDTCALHDDLDAQETAWLARRRTVADRDADAAAFGLAVESRAEGTAYVLPDAARVRDAGSGVGPGVPGFPASGTVAHAALLVLDEIAAHGRAIDSPGPGWRSLSSDEVLNHLRDLTADRTAGRGGWRGDLVAEPALLQAEVARLLESVNLLRRVAGDDLGNESWLLAPVAGRWGRADEDSDD